MSIVTDITAILEGRDERTKTRLNRAMEGAKKSWSVKKLKKKEKQILALAVQTKMPEKYETVWTKEQLRELYTFLKSHEIIAVDTETMGVNPFKDEIVGISFYAPNKGYYVPLKHIEDVSHNKIAEENYAKPGNEVGVDYVKCLPRDLVIKALKPILEDRSKKFLLHNAKFDIHVLYNWLGIDMKAYFDTMIGQALLDETQPKALKHIAPFYLNVEADRYGSMFGKTTFDKVPILIDPESRTGNLASYYAIKDTELTYMMYEFQIRHLEHPRLEELHKLYFNVEIPFLHIVADAERRGVKLDKSYLENVVAKQLHKEVEALRRNIWAYTGKINLNSPKQLSEALYVKLGLPEVNKKKPTSTDKKTLKKLAGHHEVAKLLLEYRGKVKLTTAFADKLPQEAVKGRIHTSFNPVGTKTGRMSSSSPNLQQIPSKVGNLIRNAFISDEGRLLASIDFSQQELRVLAHVSKDEVLLGIYRDGGDVHSMTATGMWNRKHPEEKVTYEEFMMARDISGLFRDVDDELVEDRFTDEYVAELRESEKLTYDITDLAKLKKWAELGFKFEKTRKEAKVVNFGIIYGMSEQGLGETLEITEEEAKQYIEGYFDAYPGVKQFMAEQRQKIKKVKYTETMLGRKRRLYPEMDSGKWWLEQKAYRMGVNAIIQGSSADMVKIASIKLQPLLKELDANIILWVHDEIIFDIPEDVGWENLQKIADIMCNALPLDCGLKSDIEVGVKWGQKMSEDEVNDLFDEEE